MKQNKFARLQTATGAASSRGEAELVRRSFVNDAELPLVLTPAFPDVDIVAWVESHREELRADLRQYGAVLLRDTRSVDRDRFKSFGEAFSDQIMDYAGGQAVRTQLDEKLYTATEYPNELEIRLHHEMSYAASWPNTLIFGCTSEPTTRGETILADSRRVYEAMPAEIRDSFERLGVTYVRRYSYSRPWQKAYQTEDRSVVEEMCRAADREWEWSGEDLVTRETRPGVRLHPETGEPVWFNFAHGFHISRMDEETRATLSSGTEKPEDVWPSNAFYGDGSVIDDETIATINDVLERHIVEVSWRKEDILIADNVLLLHGRRPFTGPRKLLLQMADPSTDQAEAVVR